MKARAPLSPAVHAEIVAAPLRADDEERMRELIDMLLSLREAIRP